MILIIKTIILYFSVIFSLRLMGKKQIAQLEPAELTVAIMMSELATIPLSEPEIPILNGIIPVFLLGAIEILISSLVIKSLKFRRLITGQPIVIVENGRLIEDALKSTRFTTDDLLCEMRLNGVSAIPDILYAILETGGRVSFFLKEDAKGENTGLVSFPVISKGVIMEKNLKTIKRDKLWLKNQLEKLKCENTKEILLLTANTKEVTFFQKRREKK